MSIQNFTAISIADGQVKLSWDAIPGTLQYQVLREPIVNGELGAQEIRGSTAGTLFIDTDAHAGNTFQYKVQAQPSGDFAEVQLVIQS